MNMKMRKKHNIQIIISIQIHIIFDTILRIKGETVYLSGQFCTKNYMYTRGTPFEALWSI